MHIIPLDRSTHLCEDVLTLYSLFHRDRVEDSYGLLSLARVVAAPERVVSDIRLPDWFSCERGQ